MRSNLPSDEIIQEILRIIRMSDEPLQTEEIVSHIKSKYGHEISRTKVMYRLNNLRAEGKIKGKMLIAGGKGVWIWWNNKLMVTARTS